MIRELYLNDVPGSAYGVYLEKAPPIRAARERGEWIEIAGMDGEAWRADGGLEGFDLECEIFVDGRADVDAVIAWLKGARTLRWGRHGWEYRVSACDTDPELEEWEDFVEEGWTCAVKWRAEPYRYLYPAADALTPTNPSTIVNPGTAWAGPLITVRGNGDITLSVGHWAVQMTGVSGGVILDCERRMAYSLDMSRVVTGQLMLISTDAGRWPRLLPGNNAISWTGAVTGVTVLPRWRSL